MDERSSRQMEATILPWVSEFWGTLCHGAWTQLQPAETTWVSASVLDPFIPSVVVRLEVHRAPWMGTLNDADENTRPSQGVGDYRYLDCKLGTTWGNQSPENCPFFLFHSFVFHCFHNDWNDPSDHMTIIMKETCLWLSTPWYFGGHILLSPW